MVSYKVTKSIVLIEGEVIGVGNVQADRTVKEDDLLMLHDVNEGGELTHNECFIFREFSWQCR